ncbi:hypothetical protein E4U55_003425 [Claviceps digitariae]|nr:hypothetical protein E4U55_003425 [Claviceps digitariae]
MPPRSPALRRRTAPSRAAHASNIGIWITDAMLMQAIVHYQRAAGTSRQFGSHPGPLESHRRTSRRHMTGLMPTSHTFPPIWELDVGSSRLQWEAPTSQEHRRQKREKTSVSGIFKSFIGWFRNWGSTDKRSSAMAVSPSDAGSSVVRSEALAVDSCSTEFIATADQVADEPMPSPELPEEIMLLRSKITNIKEDAFILGNLNQAARVCKRCLRRRIERSDLSVQGLVAALEPLDSTSRSRIPNAKMADKMSAMIRRGILQAMGDVHNQNPGAVSRELWLAFKDNLFTSTTKGDAHGIQLLAKLLEIMPASLKDDISAEKIRNLTRTLVTAQAGRKNSIPRWLALASRFNRVLQQLPAQRQREIDDDMATFLSQQDQVSDTAKRMRFAWLVIKAHTAHTSTQSFLDLYRSWLGPNHRLNSLQRWQVIFARLSALQTFDPASRNQLMEEAYTSQYARWSALLTHTMSSVHKDTALQEISAVLSGIGEFASTVRTLTLPPVHELERHTMEALAAACSSHHEVLILHDAIDMKPRAHRAQPLWSWTTWTKHVEAIIKDPAIDQSRIWKLLRLTYTPLKNTQLLAKEIAQEKNAKCHLLIQMTEWFIQAKHLTDRQVLRNLQRCLNMYRALNDGAIPSQMLAHLVGLISRDLERGQRGRTARMRWLLALISAKYGPEEAQKAARAWDGWRWVMENSCGPRLE